MKTMYLLIMLLPLAFIQPAEAQKLSKEEKAAQAAKEWEGTRQLIEGRQFNIEINQVYPQSGRDVSRFNPRGKITVRDSIAEGYLPFFGRAYRLPYGEGGGIEFDAPMQEVKFDITEKKKNRKITFSFKVPGKDDFYQISIESMGGYNCSINLISNNRTQISYSGTISSLEEKE